MHGARCRVLICRTGTVEFRETSSQLASLLTTSAALLSPQVAIGLGQARHVVVVISGAFGNLLRRREVTGHSELGEPKLQFRLIQSWELGLG